MQRTAVSAAALCVLAGSTLAALFALYVATGTDRALSEFVAALQLALALVAVGLAWLAQVAALRGPVPERSWILIAAAVALDLVWWTVVSRAGEAL